MCSSTRVRLCMPVTTFRCSDDAAVQQLCILPKLFQSPQGCTGLHMLVCGSAQVF